MRALENRRVRLSLKPLIIVSLLAGPAWSMDSGSAAAEAPTAPGSEKAQSEEVPRFDDEVTVSGEGTERPWTLEAEKEQIELRQDGDLVETFRGLPGLYSGRRGAINQDPVVRGLAEAQIGVFVDGTRTFAAGPGRMDSGLSHVSPHAVRRVEAVKGPFALTWGAGTLSAVRAHTARPEFSDGPFEAGGRAGYGYGANASAHDGHATVWGANRKVRFLVSGGVREAGDYEAGDGTTVPGSYTSYDSRWNLGFRTGQASLLEYVGGYQEQKDLDYPGRLLDASYFKTQSHMARFRHTPRGSWLAGIEADAYANLKSHLMNNDNKPTAMDMPGRKPPFGLDVDLPASSDTYGGRLQAFGARRDWSWTFGGDVYSLHQDADRSISRRSNGMVILEDVVWPEGHIVDGGLYAQASLERGAVWTGAVRVDFVDAEAKGTSDFFREVAGQDVNGSETNFSAALNGRFPVGNAWAITVGLGRAVRTASALERWADRFPSTRFQIAAEFVGNPNLRPEISHQLDAGVSYGRPGLQFQVGLFGRTIADYITVEHDPDLPKRLPLSPAMVYRYVQGEQARSWGVDTLVTHQPAPWLEWRGALSYVWGEDTKLNEPLFGQPPLNAELGVRFKGSGERFWIDASARLVDRQDRVAESRLEAPSPGWSIFNFGAGARVAGALEISLMARNLGNRLYADHLNSLNPFTGQRIPEVGRSIGIGLNYSF